MKKLLLLLKRFVPGYGRLVASNFFLNILSTVLNLFSFAAIIPILQLLFGMKTSHHIHQTFQGVQHFEDYVDVLQNNAYYSIEQIISNFGPATALMWIAIFLVVSTLFKTLSTFGASACLVPVRTGVIRDIRNQFYNKIVTMPIGYFSEERKGDLMSRMTTDVSEVEASIMSSIEAIFKNPIMIIIYIIVLFALSWELTLFAVILLPLSAILIGRIGRALKQHSLKGQQLTGDMMSQVEETISGLRVVQAFNAEKRQERKFATLTDNIRRIFNKVHMRYLLAHPVSEFLGTVVVAILLWFGGSLILGHTSQITAPQFIYYLLIFYSIIQPFKDLSKATYSVQKGMASLERIDEVLKAETDIKNSENPIPLKTFTNRISFKNIWFKYKEKWVLEDVNLEVPKGKMVALVGQSGSGKTTLVDLLPRFWEVQKGTISIDGVPVQEADIVDLRHLMGNVNQDAILFNDTFFNNICFGVDKASKEDVIRAAKIANAHEFIMNSDQGYETNIGERGGKLSGGQRQRISIARAILKNPPILILDEATSALDTESERLVQEAIFKLMENRTSLVIAHRLSTIKNSDLICVMKEGRIVERGKHDDLMQKKGYYSSLVEMQNFNPD